MIINLLYIEDTSENKQRILRSHKLGFPFYSENILYKLLVNWKSEKLQKIKTKSLMKFTVVTAKQCTSVNVNGI